MENNTIVTIILIVCLFLIFFAYLFSKYRSLKKKTKREEEMERIRAKKKEEEERILKMEETYILIMGDIEDTTIEPEDIPEEMYTNLFFSQIIDGISHPAIDPIFKELLLEGDCRTITIRNFNLKESTRFLKSTFGSFEKDFKDVSLSAKEILIYFLKNNNKLSEKNWFLLNTKPREENVTKADFRLVNVCKRYKPFIYILPLTDWGVISGSYISDESCLYIPLQSSVPIEKEVELAGVV